MNSNLRFRHFVSALFFLFSVSCSTGKKMSTGTATAGEVKTTSHAATAEPAKINTPAKPSENSRSVRPTSSSNDIQIIKSSTQTDQ